VTIAIGCTGGQHRSVTIVEELRRRLGGEWDILVRHRDVERGVEMTSTGGVEMAEKTLVIQNELGLHARAATKLVQLASKYPCDFTVTKDGHEVNGKSIMGVLMLVASKGTTVTLKAKGEKAGEVVAAVAALIDDKFGEGK
jgi:phosphocarrier protein HPr